MRTICLAGMGAIMMAVLALPSTIAHGYSASGSAVRDDTVHRAFISRAAELDNGSAPYGITIRDAFLNEVESRLFWAEDNFVPDEEIPGPTYTNSNFTAFSTTPGVSFELHGVQANLLVVAQGHYGPYALTLSSSL